MRARLLQVLLQKSGLLACRLEVIVVLLCFRSQGRRLGLQLAGAGRLFRESARRLRAGFCEVDELCFEPGYAPGCLAAAGQLGPGVRQLGLER